MSSLIPYSFKTDQLPDMEPTDLNDDNLDGKGIYFTFPREVLEDLLEKVQSWYQYRDEVVLIDYGFTVKGKLGFIIMEWQGYAPDQLFLDILRTDDLIEDFAVYEVQE